MLFNDMFTLLMIEDLGLFLYLRARLHQVSAPTLRQLSNDACDSVPIEISGIA